MNAREMRVKLYVKDFALVEHFYKDLLHLSSVHSWDRGATDRGAMFDTGSGIIELLTANAAYLPVQGCDVSLRVDDVWSLWGELRNQTKVIHALRNNAWGDTSFCVSDP